MHRASPNKKWTVLRILICQYRNLEVLRNLWAKHRQFQDIVFQPLTKPKKDMYYVKLIHVGMQVFYNVYVKNNCCEGSAIETLWQKQTERLYFLVKD